MDRRAAEPLKSSQVRLGAPTCVTCAHQPHHGLGCGHFLCHRAGHVLLVVQGEREAEMIVRVCLAIVKVNRNIAPKEQQALDVKTFSKNVEQAAVWEPLPRLPGSHLPQGMS